MKYFVWATSPLGGGYLHLEGTKRVWGSYFDAQLFTKEEVDEFFEKWDKYWEQGGKFETYREQ